MDEPRMLTRQQIYTQLEQQKSMLMKQCEVCYRHWTIDTIIEVNAIAYENSRRITPWYICPECAQKISDALKAVRMSEQELLKQLEQEKEDTEEE